MTISRRRLMAAGGLAAGIGASAAAQAAAIKPVPIARGLQNPWSLAFLPDGRMLVTERGGRLLAVTPGGSVTPVGGAPAVWARGQGGLLDVCLHPEFERNRVLYLSYAATTPQGAATRIARARLTPTGLAEVAPIFEAGPLIDNGFHFGCRMAFGRDGKLYATTGDRMRWADAAQDLGDLRGKVVRLNEDGSVPADNPFVARSGARPEIFTSGHRNPQGLALRPETGEIWLHEHGPRGGDEVNLLVAGANYGWPKATHGVNYSGSEVSPHKSLPGMEDPRWVWVPSIAPSGMAFCSSDVYPGWRGSLFVGALVAQRLVRLGFDGARIAVEERLLGGEVGRVRDVRQGRDGRLYLLTDAQDGALLRLDPA
jgi:glucose/arabinose dehydrogenase